jgi:nucleoid DNA-binding protein
MKNVTKQELTEVISNITDVKKNETEKVLERFFSLVPKILKEGRSIEIRNFGKFTVVVRKEKIARNISTRQNVTIPEHRELVFKFSKNIRKIF